MPSFCVAGTEEEEEEDEDEDLFASGAEDESLDSNSGMQYDDFFDQPTPHQKRQKKVCT